MGKRMHFYRQNIAVLIYSISLLLIVVGALFWSGTVSEKRAWEWTGALSGWVAACAALWIGYRTLQPIRDQLALQMQSARTEKFNGLNTLYDRLNSIADLVNKTYRDFACIFDDFEFSLTVFTTNLIDENEEYMRSIFFDVVKSASEQLNLIDNQIRALSLPPDRPDRLAENIRTCSELVSKTRLMRKTAIKAAMNETTRFNHTDKGFGNWHKMWCESVETSATHDEIIDVFNCIRRELSDARKTIEEERSKLR